MLRQAVVRRDPFASVARRCLAAATSKQKRALSKQQLEGTKTSAAAGGDSSKPPSPPPPSRPPPPPPPTDAARSAIVTPPGSGGGNLPLVAAGGVAVLGAAYYYFSVMQRASERTVDSTAPTSEARGEKQETVPSEDSPVKSTVSEPSSGNRVTTIQVPSKMKNSSAEVVSPPAHPKNGSRVSMSVSKPPPLDDTSETEKAVAELQESSAKEASEELIKSHQSMWSSMDAAYFGDLDELTTAQLKARVVQLATEMQDRTKWEAVRLKEFLAMKEKETADRYLQILQKQRHEFEDLLAKRLREQEDGLVKQTQKALQEKDEAVQNLINTALEAQQHEHEEDKKAFEAATKADIATKLEEELSEKVETYKVQFAQDLEQKVATLKELSDKLKKLEAALAAGQSSKEGSLKAHRLSAAALALSEKLETSQSAKKEFKALKAAAGKDGVIATALGTIPVEVESGVPTLSELQTRYESIHSKCRQAALVPEGRPGLDGQLAGMVFATLVYPPNAEDPAPEGDKNKADYILVRARKHVQLGELDRAVEQLEKLKGQPAFTVQDWKKDAMNRVAVEKALKVIKMECALLNESLTE